MAVENGFGAELEMVVDEENHDTNTNNEKIEDAKKKDTNDEGCDSSASKDDGTTVVMEVDEVQETDPLAVESEGKVMTASSKYKEGTPPPEPVITEYVKEYSGTIVRSNASKIGEDSSSKSKKSSSQQKAKIETELPVKVKEEPISEIVLIDSEEEKDEKPKIKVTPKNNMQLRANPKPSANNYKNLSNSTNSRNSGDFQIVSVDDDSPMNKNDPMNVFLCSTEEREFRKDYFKDPSSNVLKQRLHCTICDIHIGACPQNSKNMVCHRFLKVLICRKCANFYGQGEFPQDEGSDEFCRWCGEGGEVFLCNTCSNVFCQACILRNFGMGEVKRVDRLENWDCYVCDPRPLWTLRAIAFALFTYVRRIKVVAYRNGMYQTINSANAKVSKSDLMALETDLSTCCPKEVKAAAAAASAPPPNETTNDKLNKVHLAPTPTTSNAVQKMKDIKVSNQIIPPMRPITNVQSKGGPGLSNNLVQSPATPNSYSVRPQLSSKRGGKSNSKGGSAAQQWDSTNYYPGPGKRVPQQRFNQPIMYPPQHQSTLRSALVGQQPNFVQNSFPGQNMVMYGEPNKESQSETSVLLWFNGILSSLRDTMKNIENRLIFIRNSTSNLISQNEVSFLVNQLHNLLKVSCSKMQEVDCDLLKNYKEFIDKSEITVNDFDDIVREFPEFFKPQETNEEPENVESDPEPSDDINPMALVEVIEEGDQSQQSVSEVAANKQTSDTSSKKSKSTEKKSNNKEITVSPSSVTIKKEVITSEDASSISRNSTGVNGSSGKSKSVASSGTKRKSEGKEKSENGVKKLKNETLRIKKEIIENDEDEGVSLTKKCSVKLTAVNADEHC